MDIAADLIERATREQNVPIDTLVLHADNGGPMKGSTMLATLHRLGVLASFSRPRVSDDNPYAEALFRTLEEPDRRGRSMEDVDADEVLAALLSVVSSQPVNDVELMRSVSRKLGFARMGARVEAGLRSHIRRAVRHGKLAREGKTLRRVS